jgi:hypothetical protein
MDKKKKREASLAVIIFNHAQNSDAISLKKRFREEIDTFIFDSGSVISSEEEGHFDKVCDNIYYNGLINITNTFLHENGYKFGLIVTSDVQIDDIGLLLKRIKVCFGQGSMVGVYSPSVAEGFHAHTVHNPQKELERVTFTDGFCLAFRNDILRQLCPIDVDINKYGFGTNRMLGYYCLKLGYEVVIDHKLKVIHPFGSGYNTKKAVQAMHNWIKTFSFYERLFYKVASKNIFKNDFGLFLCQKIAKMDS